MTTIDLGLKCGAINLITHHKNGERSFNLLDIDHCLTWYNLAIGDEVIVQTSDDYGRVEKYSNGTEVPNLVLAKVVGYHHSSVYKNYPYIGWGKPGLYDIINNVILDTGVPFRVFVPNHSKLYLLDQEELANRNATKREGPHRFLPCLERFVAPLPDMPWHEGDFVEHLKPNGLGMCRVGSVQPTPEDYVPIRSDNLQTGTDPQNLRLIKRGPLGSELMGLPYEWESLAERVRYEQWVGRLDSIRNPESNNYHFSKTQAIAMVRCGKAHFFSQHGRDYQLTCLRNAEVGQQWAATGIELAKLTNY